MSVKENHQTSQGSYGGEPVAGGDALSSRKNDWTDYFLSAVLGLVFITAVGTTVLVIVLPKENSYYTDFFLLGPDGKAFDYPQEITPGQDYPIFIGVGNHEKRNVTYIIEIWNMNATFDTATNNTQIISMDPKDRFSFTIGENETTIIPYSMSVSKTGYNRVAFLLFNNSFPGSVLTGNSDRVNASYRDLYLGVTVR